jgi:asparagine synthetase B (glutamine-hydrolysing)
MCSIEGFTGKHKFSIEDFTSFNKDRGPDDTGYFVDENVSIGHNLLKIQDNPQMIKQPYVDNQGCVLSYNGELYSFVSSNDYGPNEWNPLESMDTDWLANIVLKITPEKLSVTEAQAHPSEVSKFHRLYDKTDGMWAFSHYNPHAKTILLCRDHFGVKPLYYMEYEGNLFWSSTQRPLLAVCHHYGIYNVPPESLEQYRKLDGFWMGPRTMYEHIKRVFPGQYLVWDIEKKSFLRKGSLWQENTEWNLSPNYNWDPEDYRERVFRAFNQVFSTGTKGTLKAISLSGGLDSSLLATTQQHRDDIFATSVSYVGSKDELTHLPLLEESKKAARLAQDCGIMHSIVECRQGEWRNNIIDTYSRINEPLWLASRCVPRKLNISNAHSLGAKIYVSGDLADEIITGYNGHQEYYLGFRRVRSTIKNQRPTYNYHSIRQNYPEDVDQAYVNEMPTDPWAGDEVNNNLFMRLLMSVDSFCGILDHLCGSYGMESRVPWAVQSLAKYALKIPSGAKLRLPTVRENERKLTQLKMVRSQTEHLFHNGKWASDIRGSYKWLIREEFKDCLPHYVTSQMKKTGFSTPWHSRDLAKNNTLREEETGEILDVVPHLYKFDLDKE